MGCAPSKGKLFAKGGVESPLPSAPEGGHLDDKPGEGLGSDEGPAELPPPVEEETPTPTNMAAMPPCPPIVPNLEHSAEIEVDMTEQKEDVQDEQTDTEKQMRRADKRRNIRARLREKDRQSSLIRTKVDLPVLMVKAHQAAYAYMNPNISKYETLLGLLDQANQTQLSLQPMLTAIVMRFEEVNQALEEMAEDGEMMLKEHGSNMAWPSGKRILPPVPTKPSNGGPYPSDPPPDLLQQMLQHSTEKMRQVGSVVHGLGDNTLEEAVEYYASVSKLLAERLQAKRAAEARLTQVLACVEAAAIRRPSPEDSFHSEDSGIGGENESLTGSDRYRRSRGSFGSGGSTHTAASHRQRNQACLNEGEEEEEEEEEEDDDYENEEDEKEESRERRERRCNSSPPDASQPGTLKHYRGRRARRPLTSEGRGHSILESESSTPLKASQMGSLLPPIAPRPPGCQSVKRLINTFSKGADGRPGQTLANVPPHIRVSRKNGTPLLPDIWVNNNNNNDMDMDSLPPPPPEVLMDNSFETTEDREDELEGHSGRGRSTTRQRNGVSQRLRASIQNVVVLPNRSSVGHTGSHCKIPPHPVDPDGPAEAENSHGTPHSPDTDPDTENEQASHLYQQARKIIHLRNAAEAESPVKRRQASDQGPRDPSPLCASVGLGEETYPCSHRPTTPPVSRARLPPSCPSTCSSSRPGSPRSIRWARESSGDESSPSISFSAARSVFSQSPAPPVTVVRRSQSDRRPGVTRTLAQKTRPRGSSTDRVSVTSGAEGDSQSDPCASAPANERSGSASSTSRNEFFRV